MPAGSVRHPANCHTLGVTRQIDHRHVVRLLAIGRVALGLAMLVLPGRALRPWIGDTDRSARVLVRGLGIRDLVLGVGTLRALDAGDPSVREWVTAGGASDATDAVATLAAGRALSLRGRLLGVAVAGLAAAASFGARDRMGR